MNKLRNLYEKAINHPYRLGKVGKPKSYAVALDKLCDEFLSVIKKKYTKDSIPPNPFYPIGNYQWSHQFGSATLCLHWNKVKEWVDRAPASLISIEAYLHTIHSFLDLGELKFFYMHNGYTKQSNDDYTFNPHTDYKYIYYPQWNEWNVQPSQAKQKMSVYKVWLDRRTKWMKSMKDKPHKYDVELIEFYKKSIARFIEIDKLSVDDIT